jgi:hypothetical protein
VAPGTAREDGRCASTRTDRVCGSHMMLAVSADAVEHLAGVGVRGRVTPGWVNMTSPATPWNLTRCALACLGHRMPQATNGHYWDVLAAGRGSKPESVCGDG